MKKHSHSVKKSEPKTMMNTVKRAIAHVMLFSVISVAGHVATTSLTASVSSMGLGIVPPIGGMQMM